MSEEVVRMPETSPAMSSYSHLKNKLLRCIDSMFAIENILARPCEDLKEKVRNNTVN